MNLQTSTYLQRIVIIGSSGSGKTTLAQQLGERLGIPHVELDALHWEANWVEASTEVFRERVTLALSGHAWVVDGNYSKARDITWPLADTVIWLDYSLPLILGRLLRRTFGRAFSRQDLWSGNRETLSKAFFSRDSILWWAITTYKRRRIEFPELFQRSEFAHLNLLHFRSPRATAEWLATLEPQKDC